MYGTGLRLCLYARASPACTASVRFCSCVVCARVLPIQVDGMGIEEVIEEREHAHHAQHRPKETLCRWQSVRIAYVCGRVVACVLTHSGKRQQCTEPVGQEVDENTEAAFSDNKLGLLQAVRQMSYAVSRGSRIARVVAHTGPYTLDAYLLGTCSSAEGRRGRRRRSTRR